MRIRWSLGFLVLVLGLGWSTSNSWAVPSFARKYKTSCATCHVAYPKLNYFGKAFRNNGYRYPAASDAAVTKEEPISLGADGYKKLFPQALWPANIAGTVPLSVRTILRAKRYESGSSDPSSFEFPHEVELFAAGTIGDTFSFFGEIEFENEDNETELGVGFALQYDPKPWVHVRVGTVSPQPVPDHLRLTAAHYSAYDNRVTPGSISLDATNPDDPLGAPLSIEASTEDARWRFRNGQAGVEVWGARNGPGDRGGLTWATGIVNGQGLDDANGRKDLYARAKYKFGGYGELGGGDTATTSEFWRDDSFAVGAFYYTGTTSNRYEGSMLALDPGEPGGISDVEVEFEIENDFDVVGIHFDWWFRDLNLFGVYLMQSDDDPLGTGEGIDSDAWFVEGNYVFFPWLIGVLRYGETELDFDTSLDPEPREFAVPAVVFMLRANVKLTLEAQLRLDDAGEGKDRYVASVDFSF